MVEVLTYALTCACLTPSVRIINLARSVCLRECSHLHPPRQLHMRTDYYLTTHQGKPLETPLIARY